MVMLHRKAVSQVEPLLPVRGDHDARGIAPDQVLEHMSV